MLEGKILITGGAGTLGRAIIARATAEHWDCDIAIMSRDTMKHARVLRRWPQVQCVVGDIRDPVTLYNAMVGKDLVIHAAAVKHIPISEFNPNDTYAVNVVGSQNVFDAALQLRTPEVLAISTDKACASHNAYGSTKYMMEKVAQEYAYLCAANQLRTKIHLVRYGNVLESTGSVVEAWHNAESEGKPIKVTDPAMTRFYISPGQAVDYVIDSLRFPPGHVYIPKMPALSLARLAEYVVGEDYPVERIPVRPGEKLHETLLTSWEAPQASAVYEEFYELYASTEHAPEHPAFGPYTSEHAPELTKGQLEELLSYESS